jgi:hypothetical protein
MPLPFSLSVPLDAQYRILAPEVAGKYAELLGGSPADAENFAAAIGKVLDELAVGSSAGAHVDLKFRREGDGIHVDFRAGTRTSTLTHSIAAARRG